MLPPILLLIYNRPDLTRRTVERLMELGVQEIHVAADGPKNATDRLLCDRARLCLEVEGLRVIPHFSETHRGCRDGVLHGLNWFFAQVDEGIILEDDCLPTRAFLPFATEVLIRHRNDPSIYMVSGNNPIGHWDSGHSHHFARIGHVWGWATWRDRWQDFDPSLHDLNTFLSNHGPTRLFGNTGFADSLISNAQDAVIGKLDTWDAQWVLHHAMQGRLAAIPRENLVENIGFGPAATHTDTRPEWISDHVGHTPLKLTAPPLTADREYATSLHMARTLNAAALRSSHVFHQQGRTTERKLRVVQVNTTDVAGGAEAVLLHQHQTLKAEGHFSSVLVRTKTLADADVMEMSADPMAQIRQLNPDIIHLHNIHGTGLSLEAIAMLAKEFPILWTLHDAWLTTGSDAHPFLYSPEDLSFLDREEWHARLQERRTLIQDGNIRLTAPSQWLRNRVATVLGAPCHFVPNAIPLPKLDEDKELLRPFILFVANHAERNRYRDLSTLRKAWEMANRQLGEKAVDLRCIGGQPAMETLGDVSYRMMGRTGTDVVLGYMRQALALVQASKQDNAPLTVMEAHSAGTPVIGSMVGGIPEMVCSEEAELLYPCGDAEALAASIVRAVMDNRRLRNAVREYFPSPSEDGNMTSTFIGHYQDMLHG